MTIRSKPLQTIRKLNYCAFIVAFDHQSFMHTADRKSILQCIPWIFFELFVSQLELAIVFVNTHDHYINIASNFGVFAWVIETFQPAQVADMDHAADPWCQFNKHTVISDVLHQSRMTAAFCEFCFDIVPWIRR